jgi:hypothetical protein
MIEMVPPCSTTNNVSGRPGGDFADTGLSKPLATSLSASVGGVSVDGSQLKFWVLPPTGPAPSPPTPPPPGLLPPVLPAPVFSPPVLPAPLPPVLPPPVAVSSPQPKPESKPAVTKNREVTLRMGHLFRVEVFEEEEEQPAERLTRGARRQPAERLTRGARNLLRFDARDDAILIDDVDLAITVLAEAAHLRNTEASIDRG